MSVKKSEKKCRSLCTKKRVNLFLHGGKNGSKVCGMCKRKRSITYLAMYPDYDTNYIMKRGGIYRAL